MVQYKRFNVDIDGDTSYFAIPEKMYISLLLLAEKLEVPYKDLIESHIVENGFSNNPIEDLLERYKTIKC